MTSQYRGPQPDRRGGGQQGRQPGPDDRSQGLHQDYLKGGYFDEDGHLRPEVVIEWARHVARLLSDGDMAGSQLRNFFGSARLIEQRQRSGTPFEALRADIARLESLAAMTVARGNAPQVFFDIMERNVQMAQHDKQSLDAFIKHLEAIVCYLTYLMRPTESRDQRR